MTSVATTLNTDRLILRKPIAADLPAYIAYCASDRAQYVGGPFPAPKAVEKFAAMIGHWDLRGFGRYVITHQGSPIGHVGPLALDDSCPPEMTWTLWTGDATGMGLASEAACAVRDHLMNGCSWPAMIMRIMPDNAASRRIAERVGAQLSDDPAPKWYPGALTYYLRPEAVA